MPVLTLDLITAAARVALVAELPASDIIDIALDLAEVER